MKLGARGVTILAASGDAGAPGRANEHCDQPDSGAINPEFPACSPYVTSVGGTMLTPANNTPMDPSTAPPLCVPQDRPNDVPRVPPLPDHFTCAKGGTPEQLASLRLGAKITSGGGFSTISPRPAWQQDAVSKYLSSAPAGLPPASHFNGANRGFPDVAALAHNYLIYASDFAMEDAWDIVDGTSASTPVWAGLVSMLNVERLSKNKPSLGFINPLLYHFASIQPSAFGDITEGDNNCTMGHCCNYGYPAAVGWDPLTGLGTPRFDLLVKYVQSLP